MRHGPGSQPDTIVTKFSLWMTHIFPWPFQEHKRKNP